MARQRQNQGERRGERAIFTCLWDRSIHGMAHDLLLCSILRDTGESDSEKERERELKKRKGRECRVYAVRHYLREEKRQRAHVSA